MSSSIYKKRYSRNEYNFSAEFSHSGADTIDYVFKPNGEGLEVEFKGVVFSKETDTAGDIQMQFELLELAVPSTGGTVVPIPILVNRDRTRSDEQDTTEFVTGATVNTTGAVSLLKATGSTDDDFVTNLTADAGYFLNPNKEYLLRSNVLDGDLTVPKTTVYGIGRNFT